MKHTETPWIADGYGEFIFSTAMPSMMVCQMRGWGHLTGEGGLGLSYQEATEIQKANQEFIVRAVNAHDELVAALKNARIVFATCAADALSESLRRAFLKDIEICDAALSKAGAL